MAYTQSKGSSMHAVSSAVVCAHIAKIAALAARQLNLSPSLEGICTVLNTAIAVGVPPRGQPAVEKFGSLEISRVTYQNRPFVVIEWPEALAGSKDIVDLTESLEREGISTTSAEVTRGSLILIGLWSRD